MARDVTRLDGARGKKQVWRPHVRNRSWGRKCTALKKALVTFLDFSAAPAVIWRLHGDSATGELCPPSLRPCIWPSVTVARRVTSGAIGAVILSNFELQILNR